MWILWGRGMSTAALLGMNLVFLLFLFRYFQHRMDRRLSSPELLEKVRREIGGMITELNMTTERNIGLIEERLSVLKETLDRADKRILLMKREAEKHEVGAQVYDRIRRNREQPDDEAPPREEGRKPVSYQEVVDLHGKGISPGVIAARLGATVGEVELIISLRDRRSRGEIGP